MANKAGKAAQGGGKGSGKGEAKGGRDVSKAKAITTTKLDKFNKQLRCALRCRLDPGPYNVSRVTALKSHTAWVKAIHETDKALAKAKKSDQAVAEAVHKASKLKGCFERDLHEMRALEVREVCF